MDSTSNLQQYQDLLNHLSRLDTSIAPFATSADQYELGCAIKIARQLSAQATPAPLPTIPLPCDSEVSQCAVALLKAHTLHTACPASATANRLNATRYVFLNALDAAEILYYDEPYSMEQLVEMAREHVRMLDAQQWSEPAPAKERCPHYKTIKRTMAIIGGLNVKPTKAEMLNAFNRYLGTSYTSRSQMSAGEWAIVGDAIDRNCLQFGGAR